VVIGQLECPRRDFTYQQNVILLHFYGFGPHTHMKASPQHIGLRLILAALLSLSLLSSGVLSAHVHDDGLSHYSDCDRCTQLGGLELSPATAITLTPFATATLLFSPTSRVPSVNHARYFSARAPPSLLSQHHNP
jgi:hypothetical protein